MKKLRQKTKKALEKQDNLTSDTHDGDNNLNESVKDLDPVKNSNDLNDNDGKDNNLGDSASNNNMEPPDNHLEATPKVVPEETGNKVVQSVIEILKTIPCPIDPLFSDGLVNDDGHWVRPAGWVQAEVTSNDSTAVRAEDSSVKQPNLPHGAESRAAVPTKDLKPANTEERKAFTKHLVQMIHELSRQNV